MKNRSHQQRYILTSIIGSQGTNIPWHLSRASVKRTYGVYYALRLPPDVQIELQRRTADFRNFFYPSKIDTRDVQNCQKPRPLLTSCIMFAPPIYRKFTTCVHWASKDVPLSACGSFIDSRLTCRGTLLIAVWSLHVFVKRDELINWCLYNLTFSCDTRNIRSRAFKTLTNEPENFRSGGIFQVAFLYSKTSWQPYQFQNLTNTQRMHEK